MTSLSNTKSFDLSRSAVLWQWDNFELRYIFRVHSTGISGSVEAKLNLTVSVGKKRWRTQLLQRLMTCLSNTKSFDLSRSAVLWQYALPFRPESKRSPGIPCSNHSCLLLFVALWPSWLQHTAKIDNYSSSMLAIPLPIFHSLSVIIYLSYDFNSKTITRVHRVYTDGVDCLSYLRMYVDASRARGSETFSVSSSFSFLYA